MPLRFARPHHQCSLLHGIGRSTQTLSSDTVCHGQTVAAGSVTNSAFHVSWQIRTSNHRVAPCARGSRWPGVAEPTEARRADGGPWASRTGAHLWVFRRDHGFVPQRAARPL